MSASSNAGRTVRHLERLRREDVTPAQTMGYEADGIAAPVVGDEEAPYLKVPPFSTVPQLWAQFTVEEGEAQNQYIALPPLEIAQIRTVTTYFVVTSGAAGDTAQLSIIGGTYLPTAPGEPVVIDNFYTIAVIDPTPTTVPLTAPFDADAISRVATMGELRTQTMVGGSPPDTLRFVLQWDVAPYQNFALYLASVSIADPIISVRVHYAYAS